MAGIVDEARIAPFAKRLKQSITANGEGANPASDDSGHRPKRRSE